MARGRLIYEEECRLCAASARWAAARAPEAIEIVPFGDERVPAALDADRSQVHYLEGDEVWHGGAAVTRVLRSGRAGRLASMLDLPVVWRLRDAGYRVVARLHRRGGR